MHSTKPLLEDGGFPRVSGHPVRSGRDFSAFQAFLEEQRRNRPLIESDSIDLVVSNCVLNLVEEHDKERLIREIFAARGLDYGDQHERRASGSILAESYALGADCFTIFQDIP